jgi:uncharacterized Rmd1/YagE family protein
VSKLSCSKRTPSLLRLEAVQNETKAWMSKRFWFSSKSIGNQETTAISGNRSNLIKEEKKKKDLLHVYEAQRICAFSTTHATASFAATTANNMTRRQTKKREMNPPATPGVFDTAEDAAWNKAVAEVEREQREMMIDEFGSNANADHEHQEHSSNANANANASHSSSRLDYSLPVRAYYIGSTVDFRRLARELPTYPKEFTRECVVIRLAARRSAELVSDDNFNFNLNHHHRSNNDNYSSSSSGGSNSNNNSSSSDTNKIDSASNEKLTLASLQKAAEDAFKMKGINNNNNNTDVESGFAQAFEKLEKDAEDAQTSTTSTTTRIPSTDLMRYMVVFKFGSVVFYNVGAKEREECLELTKNFVETPLSYPMTEDYMVKVSPRLDEWAKLESDHIVLKRLDVNNISVISAVLAQTVALEHYEQKVDAMLEIFSKLNKSTELTGDLNISKKRLFSLVAENNNTLTELITKLGLLGRSDTAWQFAQYNIVWEGLRQDFELEDRFQDLDYKLNLIQTQVKFYLEILQNRKSDFLEWTIIVLIALEICVSLYDMAEKLPRIPFLPPF